MDWLLRLNSYCNALDTYRVNIVSAGIIITEKELNYITCFADRKIWMKGHEEVIVSNARPGICLVGGFKDKESRLHCAVCTYLHSVSISRT